MPYTSLLVLCLLSMSRADQSASRPRKRSRLRSDTVEVTERELDLWWNAVGSDTFVANGLPPTFCSVPEDPSVLGHQSASSDMPEYGIPNRDIQDLPRSPEKTKSRPPKSPKKRKSDAPPKDQQKSGEGIKDTLLTFMDDNIRTMRRVRQAHAKLSVLKESQNAEDGGEGEETVGASSIGGKMLTGSGAGLPPPLEEDVDGHRSKRAKRWRPSYVEYEVTPPQSMHGVKTETGRRGSSERRRPAKPIGDMVINEQAAEQCLGWMSGTVLEHAGFQGEFSSSISFAIFAMLRLLRQERPKSPWMSSLV
jgi:transcriptional activator SPT7